MAVAYATIANGGTVPRPHVGHAGGGRGGAGAAGNRASTRPVRCGSTPSGATTILAGLHDAAQSPGRHLLRRLRRLPGAGRGQDRHRGAPRVRRSVMVCRACPLPGPRDSRRRDLRGRAASAPTRPPRPPSRSSPSTSSKNAKPVEERQGRSSSRCTRLAPAKPAPSRSPSGPASPSGSACPTWTRTLVVSAVALAAFSVFVLGQATVRDVPGSPGYFADRQAIYAAIGLAGMYPARPRRLLALPRAAGRHLHLPLRQRLARLRLRLRGARLAARLRPSLLQLPAIGARQAPACARACRVRHRWRPAGLGEAAHGALPLPRPRPGCARIPAAGPRHLPGVRGHHPRRDVRGGRPLDAPRDDRRGPRRTQSQSSSWSRPQSGRRS